MIPQLVNVNIETYCLEIILHNLHCWGTFDWIQWDIMTVDEGKSFSQGLRSYWKPWISACFPCYSFHPRLSQVSIKTDLGGSTREKNLVSFSPFFLWRELSSVVHEWTTPLQLHVRTRCFSPCCCDGHIPRSATAAAQVENRNTPGYGCSRRTNALHSAALWLCRSRRWASGMVEWPGRWPYCSLRPP